MAIDPDYKFFSLITPNQHEKNEWARMAQAAYAWGLNSEGHRYSAAASLPHDGKIRLAYFDALQRDYRVWLVDGLFPFPITTLSE